MKDPELAEAFKVAQQRLASLTSSETYICVALNNSHRDPAVVCLAHKIISSRLEGTHTLRRWLSSKGVPAQELTGTRLRAHRIAWLDLLIKEFE